MKRLRFLSIIALLLVLVLAAPFSAQDRFGDLDRVIAAELAETRTPGAIVAIVQDGAVAFLKGVGIANVETGQPMSADMVFPLASMTKMYTAVTLASLAEEGRIDLSAPIGKYIAGLPPKLGAVTAHQLLSHTAGFLDNAGISDQGYDDHTIDEQAMAYTDTIFFTEPGVVFSYANQGYNLSGLLIQHLSGKRYSQAVRERIFAPLKMSHSTFSLAMAATWPMSQTHAGQPGQPPVVLRPMGVQAPWPVGGLFSSMADLARFARALLDGGDLDGQHVLPPAVIKRVTTPVAAVHSQVDGGQYGYGLIMLEDRGVKLIEHGGTLGGSATDFVLAPDRHVAIIVFANRQAHLTRTVNRALELALGLPRKAAAMPVPMKAGEAGEYVGRYWQGIGVPAEVVAAGEGIGLKTGTAVLPLTRIDKDAFLVSLPGFTDPIRVEFVRGADGKVQFLHNRLRALKRIPPADR